MEKFTVHTGTVVPLRRSDVDTDQIIPGKYCVNPRKTGYADVLFANWREDPGFVLNRPERHGASILVAGDNFGTGSSREAAVWALQNYGFRAVIAPRFGDIFRGNALMNALLPVAVPGDTVETLWKMAEADPAAPVTIDVETLTVRFDDQTVAFPLDPDTRNRLLLGLDLIDATLDQESLIAGYEARRAPTPSTTARAAGVSPR
jgi:3-isopropylmalate/(R)-2-methylmalate dehydratase small subunit